MHETGVIHDLVHRIEAAARDAGAERVASVEVYLGALSQMSAEHFREHFDTEARGTVAEGATLKLDVADDPAAPEALSVVLRSVELEV